MSTFLGVSLMVLALAFSRVHVNADPSVGGGSGGSASARATDAFGVGSDDVGTDTTTLFRAPKDNRRVRWYWSPISGWESKEIEETYENGWAWVWRDGEWRWEQQAAGHAAAPDVTNEKTSDVDVVGDESAACFDAAGALTTDRESCSRDQASAARQADEELLPPALKSIVRDTAPYASGEETRVLYALRMRFEESVMDSRKHVIERAASDAVSRLGILKDLDTVTENEKQYLIGRIAAVQNVLSQTVDAESSDALLGLSSTLSTIVGETSGYIKAHGITVPVEGAPTAARVLADAGRMIDALPAAFSALDDAGYSTVNLRSMLASTVALHDDVGVQCRQGTECSRIRDVVNQLSRTVATLNDMVFASGDSVLKSDVQQRFDKAMNR